jgi:hypothetical protein
MEDAGYLVLRFGHADDWERLAVRFPSVFGEPAPLAAGDVATATATEA